MISSVAAGGLGAAVGFALQLLLARVLKSEEYGLYAYAVSWLGLLGLLGKLELDGAAVRYFGEYAATRRWSLAVGYLRFGAGTVVAASVIVSLGIVAVAAVVGDRTGNTERMHAMFVAAALLPVTSLMLLLSSALQGLKRVFLAQVPAGALRPALVGIAVAALTLAGYELVAKDVLWLQVLATVLVAALLAVVVRRTVSRRAGEPLRPTYNFRGWLGTATGLMWVSVGQVILGKQTDVVIVGGMFGQEAAGHYSAAMQLTAIPQLFVSALLFVAVPLVAEFYHSGQTARLQRLVDSIARINLVVVAPILVVMAAAGPWLLGLYGEPFKAGYPVLLVGLLQVLEGALIGGVAGFSLTMTGNERRAAVVMLLSAAIYVPLAFLLGGWLGPYGVALATLLSFLIRAIILARDCKRLIGISLISFLRPRAEAAQ